MTRNYKYFYFIFLLGGLLFFFSCKTSRSTTGSVALVKMGKEERIESIQYQSIQYNTLSSSMRFGIKSGAQKSMTANAQLRIIKDKIIQFSIRIPILGTELARVSITPEQIVILDRMNKRYCSESMEQLQQISSFDFDFYSLQALFSNQLFIAGRPEISKGDYSTFKWSEDEFHTTLNNVDNQGIHYDFISDFTNRIIKTEMYKNKAQADMNWSYQDFGLTSNNKLFPMKMNLELTLPKDLITLNLTFNTVDIDTDFELDTTIPSKYQPIGIGQIIKLIQSLG